jgi:hypothetical protein
MRKITHNIIKQRLLSQSNKSRFLNPTFITKELNQIARIIRHKKFSKKLIFLLTEDRIKISIIKNYLIKFYRKNKICFGTNKELHSLRNSKNIKIIFILDDLGAYSQKIVTRENLLYNRLIVYPFASLKPLNNYSLNFSYETKNKLFWLLSFIKYLNKKKTFKFL